MLPPFSHFPLWTQQVTLYKGLNQDTHASNSSIEHSQTYTHSPGKMMQNECIDVSAEDLATFEHQVWSMKIEFINNYHTGLSKTIVREQNVEVTPEK